MSDFRHLLKPGETVAHALTVVDVKPDDEIIVDWPSNRYPHLFEEPIRFTVVHVFFNGVVKVRVDGWEPQVPSINLPDSVWFYTYVIQKEGSK